MSNYVINEHNHPRKHRKPSLKTLPAGRPRQIKPEDKKPGVDFFSSSGFRYRDGRGASETNHQSNPKNI